MYQVHQAKWADILSCWLRLLILARIRCSRGRLGGPTAKRSILSTPFCKQYETLLFCLNGHLVRFELWGFSIVTSKAGRRDLSASRTGSPVRQGKRSVIVLVMV